MATIWLIAFSILVILFVYVVVKFMKITQKLTEMIKTFERVPGIPRHWFFGNVKELTVWSDFVFNMQKLMVDKGEKMYIFWIFHIPIIVVTHPDTVKDIMRSSEPKTPGVLGYGGLIPWLGDSLLISNGTKWERNRRLLTPAFHFDILKPYVKIFNQVADVLIEKMSIAAEENKSFEVFKPAGLATLDSLLQCALSYKGNLQQTGGDHPYVMAVRRLNQLIILRTLKPHHYYDVLYKLSNEGREFYKLCDYVHDFSAKIITERRKILNENPDVLSKRHLDVLDILLTAKDGDGQGLTDEEIRDEVDTFMFAGHDTTATVLSWSLYALAKFPEQQTKVYEELKEVIGDRQDIEWDDLTKLKYFSCFMKEVMRLYTPVPIVSRMLTKPLCMDGVTVPAGTQIDLGLYHIHHHPDTWPDQYEFKPERFQSDDIVNKDPYSFVPFSAGPRLSDKIERLIDQSISDLIGDVRLVGHCEIFNKHLCTLHSKSLDAPSLAKNCIGQNFAQNEYKVILSRIVNRFEISLDPDHDVVPYIDAVLRTESGIHIKLTDRRKP